MVLFELLQLARVFLYYLRIEYLWHALIMPLTNRNGMRGEVFIGAGRLYGGGYDLARGHLEVGDQTSGGVADVFVLLALDLAGAHRKGRMEAFEGLDARLLVGADQMNVNALLVQGERFGVMLANSPN